MKIKNKKRIFPFLSFIILFLSACFLFVFFVEIKNEKSNTVFHPYSPKSEIIVIIDPGHGGEDGGAIGVNGCLEKDINLQISKKLYQQLTEKGIKSILTRTTDTLLYDKSSDYQGQKKKLDMQARKAIVDKTENAIFISIHQNTFSVEKYNGFQAYYSTENQNSKGLSEILEKTVKEQLQPQNKRTSKPSDGIFLLDNVNCPAVLLECGFLTNKKECELLCNEEYQNKLVKALSNGIEKYCKNSLLFSSDT